MAIAFVLDEHLRGPLWTAIQTRNAASPDSPVEAVRVGDPADLPLGSSDRAILAWAVREGRVVVSQDQSTLPQHLADHLALGGHSPGVFIVRGVGTIPEVVSFLEAVPYASEPFEWQDRVQFIP